MKKILLSLVVLATLLSSCSNGQQNSTVTSANQQAPVVENVNAQKLKELIAQHPEGIVLDVRTPEEIAKGHLANASIIDFYDEAFQQKVKMIRKDVPVFVYCAAGSRSAKAAEQMSTIGFTKVYNLEGGYNGWLNAGYDVVKNDGVTVSTAEKFSVEQITTLLKNNKVLLLDFHTTWCIPCKKMAPVIDELKKEFAGKIFIQSIDADANKELAEQYKVESIPVFILMKDGKEVSRKTGLIPKEELVNAINKAL